MTDDIRGPRFSRFGDGVAIHYPTGYTPGRDHLDASDATLDARLLLRGEDPAASHGERAQWRRLAAAEGWPVVATDGDRDGVTRALLTWALRVLA